MGALYGLIRPGGPPVCPADLEPMTRALRAWGPDGGGTWCDGTAGLGRLVARRTPEPVTGGPPRQLPGGTVVAAYGRLDNRDELCVELGVRPADRGRTDDAELMVAAYERWGDDVAPRLLGDWALAAYDPCSRRLVLTRDHFGQTGIYYHLDGRRLAFASSIGALLALPDVRPCLDELQLARHLVPWPDDGTTTLYEGIRALPPAHRLTFEGTKVTTCQFWDLRDAPEVRLGSDRDYIERFREVLTAAVRARTRAPGPVASTLSSGLDSSAVTALAAAEAEREGRRLTALTAVPAHPEVARDLPGALVDEWPGARLVAANYPAIDDHVAVDGRAIAPTEAIARVLAIHGLPVWAAGNMPWLLALLEACRERGVTVLLTGQMGNGGVSWAGEPAWERLRAGDARGALAALVARTRIPGGSWPAVARHELLGPVRQRLAQEVTCLRRRRDGTVAGPLVDPRFARRLDLAGRMRAAGYDPVRRPRRAGERRLAVLHPGVNPVGALYHTLGATYGLDIRDPTADVRVLEFCFGIPPDQFSRGGDRWLMRRALEGLVPPAIQWNRRRGIQWADLPYRLRADAPAVTAAVEGVAASPVTARYLDAGGLRHRWDRVRSEAGAAALPPAAELIRGLAYGAFLTRIEV